MTQDRSVNISESGKIEGIVSTGDNSINIYKQGSQSEENYLLDLRVIMDELAEEFPGASIKDKRNILKREIKNAFQTKPTFKHRFISAVKAGGSELIKVLTNNPFVSVPLEVVKGWLEADV